MKGGRERDRRGGRRGRNSRDEVVGPAVINEAAKATNEGTSWDTGAGVRPRLRASCRDSV